MAEPYRVFNGPGEILKATEAILTDPTVDLAVVRNMVTPSAGPELRRSQREKRAAILNQEVPDLPKAEEFAHEWWEEYGYPDSVPVGGFTYGTLIDPGQSIKMHTDNSGPQKRLRGPLSISLGFIDVAMWQAQKPGKPLMNSRQRYSRLRHLAWGCVAELTLVGSANGWIDQQPTDGVLMAQHPWLTAHRVRARPLREGHIFDMLLERTE